MAKVITLAQITPKAETAEETKATAVHLSVLKGGQAVPEGCTAFVVPNKIPLSALQQSDDKVDKKGNAREGAIFCYLRMPVKDGAMPTASIDVEAPDGTTIAKTFRFGGFNAFMNKA